MRLEKIGRVEEEDRAFDVLKLTVGENEISAIQFDGEEPMFSAGDYLRCIGAKRVGGSYYTHLLDVSSKSVTLGTRRGTYVSLDGLVRHSARMRQEELNPFIKEVIEVVSQAM